MALISFHNNKRQTTELVCYVNRFANRSHKDRAYKRSFWNLAKKLSAFEKHRSLKLMSDSFSYQTTEDFIYYLKETFPYRTSTLESLIGKLSSVLHAAHRDELRINFGFSEYRIKSEETSAIYLTTEEIKRIFELKKLSTSASAIRDRFIIGCCTGLRYSDFSQLAIDNISNNTIQIKTKKTGVKVILPVHFMISEIIERNGGRLPKIVTSRQNFNKVIKNVCKSAKITSQVLVERTEGNKIIRKKVKKYELVASHTARRSFATNMKLAGVETAKIMLFTGHTTEQAFFKYIRIEKQENADELAGHIFFVKKVAETIA